MPTKKTVAADKATNKGKILVIVESPAKVKTVKKYLGAKYEVMSSKGHIRDLPASRLAVDIENGFTPEYIIPRKDGKSALVKELKTAAKESKAVFLATDPDREGEAIAWHLSEVLGLDESAANRITFNEITKSAVTAGIENPRPLDMNLVSSQQTRRVLDRIVGYKLSPYLWHKVKYGLSAGRVQSVATRLVVDREREIQAFVPTEYWNVDAVFPNGKKTYAARLTTKNGKRFTVSDAKENADVLEELKNAEFRVVSLQETEKNKMPPAPYTTSSLQQDASFRLNMRPQKTMAIAQGLYEGVELPGHGPIGLITYMRTDSLRISEEARSSAKSYIASVFGSHYYPATPRVYKTRAGAQDAHEAIRPTDVTLTPESLKESLSREQYQLYKLIWERFLASQMASAVYHTRALEVAAGPYGFRANDTKLAFDGYTKIFKYGEDEEKSAFPHLSEGEKLPKPELQSEQKFTQPPSRYTEGSLIKMLEENGVGRPSTYAPIVGTISERKYVEREGKTMKPTELGFVTTDLMTEHFPSIVDINFTAEMETQLDEVQDGKKTPIEILEGFYRDFSNSLEKAEETTEKTTVKSAAEESDVICEKCGRKMVYKNGKFGRFLACPGYPTCKNTKPVLQYTDGTCPTCGKKLVLRKTRTGKSYFSCETAPECAFQTWNTPTKQVCPTCGKTLFRKFGQLICETEGCGYTAAAPKKEKKSDDEA